MRRPRPPAEPPKTVSVNDAADILCTTVREMFKGAGVDAEVSDPFLIDNQLLVRILDGERLTEATISTRELPRLVEKKVREQIGQVAREALEKVVAARR